MKSFVYFIRDPHHQAIKIGTSSNVRSRFQSLDIGAAPMEFMGCIPGDHQEERSWHEKFSHLWVRREWFRAEPDLLEAISKALSQPKPAPIYSPSAAPKGYIFDRLPPASESIYTSEGDGFRITYPSLSGFSLKFVPTPSQN